MGVARSTDNSGAMQRYLVNVSTSAIHDFQAGEATKAYALTKNSGMLLMQQLARDTPVDKMQIVSFHPGAILSPGAKSGGADESSLNWDDSEYSPTVLRHDPPIHIVQSASPPRLPSGRLQTRQHFCTAASYGRHGMLKSCRRGRSASA